MCIYRGKLDRQIAVTHEQTNADATGLFREMVMELDGSRALSQQFVTQTMSVSLKKLTSRSQRLLANTKQ